MMKNGLVQGNSALRADKGTSSQRVLAAAN